MHRKTFIQHAALLASGALLTPHILRAQRKEDPVILLVSGWQDVNIGDIAHTPGLLHVLQTFIPRARIILWKRSTGETVRKMLERDFPKVKIIYGNVDADKNVDNPEVMEAFRDADIMIHGSGPSVVGKTNLEAWAKHTAKPFGIFGTTIQNINDSLKTLLEKASFIYTRETASLKVLKTAGITGRHISFAPDATFYMDIRDDAKGDRFLSENKLEAQKFICAIPRLRVTPYYKIRENNAGWSDEKIRQVNALNDSKKEADHAKLREAMTAWVRETGHKVLVCPEMTYEVDIMDELLIDPLPADVKPYVIKRGYWLPDEAASVYAKAHTVLSFECHSPIIAAANGVPFFYLRQPEDTIKGQMYYDLGFDDWVFEIEQRSGAQITAELRKVWQHYDQAKDKVASGMRQVGKIYAAATGVVRQEIGHIRK
ncbi:polysaccharide pyruvyl transferase family protein [Compostibacter hankyongensis]|uniref:Polysaccharide pyruvyl transferase family protein n=1 Tax=Compostibacter hankyongensis TaxID=1007089 RepID=A0ABP8G178_9BACT